MPDEGVVEVDGGNGGGGGEMLHCGSGGNGGMAIGDGVLE